jgi:hypothetical protein
MHSSKTIQLELAVAEDRTGSGGLYAAYQPVSTGIGVEAALPLWAI